MSDLKTTLKESKLLLSTGRNQEAIDILQPLLDREIEDYLLFSFAALANANLEEYEEAQELYEKGIKLDTTKPQAWQGLFKLYDAEDVDLDKRGLDVCRKILEIGDDEKKIAAKNLTRRIWLKCSLYEDLMSDLGNDPDLMTDIIDKLETKRQPTAVERKLLEDSFQQLASNFSEYPEYQLKFCKFLYDNERDFREQILNYCSVSERTEWLCARLIELLAEDYFINSNIEDNIIWTYLDEDKVSETFKMSLLILKKIKANDITGALELLDQLSYGQTVSYPVCLLACRLLVEIEKWEELVKVLNAFPKRSYLSPDLARTRDWLIVRGNIEIDGTVPDNKLIDTCCSADYVPNEFIKDRIILGMSAGKGTDNWKEKLDEFAQIRTSFLEAFYTKNYATAIDIGASLIESGKACWLDLLGVAEARFASNLDCVPLLVKAAKMAPRSSRIFYMLGRALQKKNPTKAKGCLERAVKIRPFNSEYVQELDEILEALNEKPEIRLTYLKPLVAKTRNKWIREKVAKLALAAGDLDTAIDEFQRLLRESPKNIVLWAQLAESYSKRGHYNSAVSAYEQILEHQPASDHYISLVGLLIRLRKDEEALEKCHKWREMASSNTEVAIFMDILETMAHVRLSLTTYGEEKINNLSQAVHLLSPVIAKEPHLSMPYKLAGDILLHISRYRDTFFELFKLDESWQITPSNILEKATDYYAKALQLAKNNILAWSDLAISLLLTSQRTKKQEPAANALDLLKRAMTLTNVDTTKSYLWTLVGEGRRLIKQSPASQQHCYIRALELNKANDEAWLRLAVLYMESGEMSKAHQAIETAVKYNPQSSEAWCAWAILAEKDNVKSEATAMYRQSLTIKSLPIAVKKFTTFVCEDMKKTQVNFDTSSVLRDFPEIFDIYYSFHTQNNASLLRHLGVLAELFGHYADAINCFRDAGVAEDEANLQRVLLKEEQPINGNVILNEKWVKLTKDPLEKLLEHVKENPIYCNVFKFLQEDDENSNGLREMFLKHQKQISMPLIISAIIVFKIQISDTAVEVLHDVLPRHELVDVFPTVLPDGMDTQLQYLEQDGEAPFRYRHEISKKLYEALKKKQEELEIK